MWDTVGCAMRCARVGDASSVAGSMGTFLGLPRRLGGSGVDEVELCTIEPSCARIGALANTSSPDMLATASASSIRLAVELGCCPTSSHRVRNLSSIMSRSGVRRRLICGRDMVCLLCGVTVGSVRPFGWPGYNPTMRYSPRRRQVKRFFEVVCVG